MANDLHTAPDTNITALVTGIINDAQELFKQQLALVRSEIRSDFQKTKEAIQSIAIGAGIAVIAVILVSLALVYLLNWAMPELHLWACYALVGATFAVVGALLIYAGVKKFQSFNPLPDQSVEALTENLRWTTNPRSSGSR
jgi:putative superfamily III holin-X